MSFWFGTNHFSHLEQVGERFVYVMGSAWVGVLFEREVFDYESPEAGVSLNELKKVLESLPSTMVAKFHRRSVYLDGEKPSRSTRLFLGIEGKSTRSRSTIERVRKSAIEAWLSQVPLQALLNLGFKYCSEGEVLGEFGLTAEPIVRTSFGVRQGGRQAAIIRLNRQNPGQINDWTLSKILLKLPVSSTLSVTYRRLEDLRAQQVLRQKESKKKNTGDVRDEAPARATADAIRATFSGDQSLIATEWLFLLEGRTQDEIEVAIPKVVSQLGELGECYVETVGATPSFRAAQFGSPPHFEFLEVSSAMGCYLPVFGCAVEPLDPTGSHFKAYRTDDTPVAIDFFKPEYGGCNIVINGIRGGGKSVTANIVSKTLLSDSRVQLIKFDVGGSYRKECQLAGGEIFDFREDAPSGINPMLLPTDIEIGPDFIRTISGFLAALIQETAEPALPQNIAAALEASVQAYYSEGPQRASLKDFVERGRGIPRSDLLKRWSHGLLKEIFKDVPNAASRIENRYVYFNLEQLSSAADSTYIKGAFGALIAFANIAMLRSGDARKQNRRRVVLFADEVPFVSKVYADYLKFTTANFRKFGHGTVLIAQSLDSLTIDRPGQPRDFAIIKQSPIRFLFDVETPVERFQSDCGLGNDEIEKIKRLYRGREFRECLLQLPHPTCGTETRTLRIRLTPEELWEFTSSETDNAKLYSVLQAVPGLTLGEAIRCLSAVQRQGVA